MDQSADLRQFDSDVMISVYVQHAGWHTVQCLWPQKSLVQWVLKVERYEGGQTLKVECKEEGENTAIKWRNEVTAFEASTRDGHETE